MRTSHEHFELAAFLVDRIPREDLPRLSELLPEAMVVCFVRARRATPRMELAYMLRDRFAVSRATAYRWLSLIERADRAGDEGAPVAATTGQEQLQEARW